jgi:hypothetical protein
MLIPAGGMSEDNMEWVHCGKKFFAPIKILSRVFRGKFISMMESLKKEEKIKVDITALKPLLYKKDWVVYAKKSFAGPSQILQYLGRYTHRIAISNSRIINHQNGLVSFRWKDYRNKACWKTMQLHTLEFIRRFLLHVLPCNFYKIRYYGIMALAYRRQTLMLCRASIQLQKNITLISGVRHEKVPHRFNRICPICQVGTLIFFKLLLPRTE